MKWWDWGAGTLYVCFCQHAIVDCSAGATAKNIEVILTHLVVLIMVCLCVCVRARARVRVKARVCMCVVL